MIDRTHEKEYVNHFQKFGSGQEAVHQTRAICHIADMLTAIACDIRAIRETNEEGESQNG